MEVRRLPIAIALILVSAGTAGAAGVRSLALPARQGGDRLERTAGATADALARRLGMTRLEDRRDPSLEARLDESLALALAGRLDDAASSLEVSIAAAMDSLHELGASVRLLDAHAMLASIEEARGHQGRADELLDRVLELDPGFEPRPEQKSPRLLEALRRAHARHRGAPELRVATLGRACRGADVLVVARGAADGRVELFRFEGCRLVARARAGAGETAERLAISLDPGVPSSPRPIYRKPWFWVGCAAVVAAGSVATYFLLRDEPSTDIVPIP